MEWGERMAARRHGTIVTLDGVAVLTVLPGHRTKIVFDRLIIAHPDKRPLMVNLFTGDIHVIDASYDPNSNL